METYHIIYFCCIDCCISAQVVRQRSVQAELYLFKYDIFDFIINRQQMHQNYLQRLPPTNSAGLFDWLFCCRGRQGDFHNDQLPIRNTVVRKKPINLRTETHRDTLHHRRTLNARFDTLGNETGRMSSNTIISVPLRHSLHENQLSRQQHAQRTQKPRPTCNVRFVYTDSAAQLPGTSREQKNLQTVSKSGMSNLETKESFLNARPAALQVINELALNRNSSNLLRNTSSSAYSEEVPSPMSLMQKRSSQSIEKKGGKRSKKPWERFSLKMRQVVSIREPQQDSDHQSFVEQQGLGVLDAIREVQRESRIEA